MASNDSNAEKGEALRLYLRRYVPPLKPTTKPERSKPPQFNSIHIHKKPTGRSTPSYCGR